MQQSPSNLSISSNSPFSSSPINFNQSLTEQITLNTTQNVVGDPAEENADIVYFSDFVEFGSFRVFEGATGTVQLLGRFSDGSLNFAGFGEVLSDPSTGFLNDSILPDIGLPV